MTHNQFYHVNPNFPSWTQVPGVVYLRPSATPWPFERPSFAEMRELQLYHQAEMARAQAFYANRYEGVQLPFQPEDVDPDPDAPENNSEPEPPPEIVISEEEEEEEDEEDEEEYARNERDYLIASILDLVTRPMGPTPTGRHDDEESPVPPKTTGVSPHLQGIFTRCYEKSTEKHTCSVCMDVIPHTTEEEDMKISVGKCGHTFHSGCVQHWFSCDHGLDGTCPECRSDY